MPVTVGSQRPPRGHYGPYGALVGRVGGVGRVDDEIFLDRIDLDYSI